MTMMKVLSYLLTLFLLASSTRGFSTASSPKKSDTILSIQHDDNHDESLSRRSTPKKADVVLSSNNKIHIDDNHDESLSRRHFFQQSLVVASALATTTLSSLPQPAAASGGATAGGVYLLSAKQRYNERVKKGVAGFLVLGAALEQGDINKLRDYFASEDVGSWKDLTSAGYLLANAFRRNSSAAPDSLPSVKAWKKFATEVEGMTKSLKKKDSAGAMTAYKSAVDALGDYLTQVELPSVAELAA